MALTGNEKLLIAIAAWYDPKYQCVDAVHRLIKPKDLRWIDIKYSSGWEAAQCRNHTAKDALKHGYDYILFVDGDQILSNNTLINLFGGLKDVNGKIISAYGQHTVKSKMSNIFMSANQLYEIQNLASVPQIMQCYAHGFGCVLCETSVFKEIEQPYFSYIESAGDTPFKNEDIYFAEKLEEAGIPRYVDARTRMLHIKQTLI